MTPALRDLSDLTLMGLGRQIEKELRRRDRERYEQRTWTTASFRAMAANASDLTVDIVRGLSDPELADRTAAALEKREAEVRDGTRRKERVRR